ncbi:hypothetical protein F0562_022623 [Nyssa sinensis]|uniref:Uncharacterized protein n=1 Tax=Nyssa sinensis TaxID=561372 RepID=A0A5J5BPJ5_9ASTE|nr:hypothetical protein F0562_022623 [Nyssa sinensis]
MASIEASIHDQEKSPSEPIPNVSSLLSYPITGFCPGANVDRIGVDEATVIAHVNTQAPPLHTNSSTSAVASQAISTCHLAVAPFHMQGDALATNTANRPAIRSSASAAGVHSVEGSFGDGVPITCSASAVCTREATSNTNGLEPTIHSLRDIPNAFSDAVRPAANQIGGTPQVSSALNQSFIPPIHPQAPVQSQTPVH